MSGTYGVDPKAFDSVRDLADLIRVLNPSEGRFISCFPKNWIEELKNHLGDLSDLEKSRFVELWITRARSGLLPTSIPFDCSISWAQNAQRLKVETRALIGRKEDRPKVIPLEDALIDPSVFLDVRSEYVMRSSPDYARVAKPLFKISKKIVLIDPYFTLWWGEHKEFTKSSWRHLGPLKAFLSECVVSGSVEVFCLVIDKAYALKPYPEQEGEERFVSELTRIQGEVGAGEILIEYDYLDRRKFTDQHKRFLLGNSAGLQFEWGFDTSHPDRRSEERNLAIWLSEKALQPLLARFF